MVKSQIKKQKGLKRKEIDSLILSLDEKKKLEKKLEERQKDLEIIFDSIPAWIFYKNKENRFIKVNKTFADVMKMTKEKLEGKSMFELYPKKQAEAYGKDDKEQ